MSFVAPTVAQTAPTSEKDDQEGDPEEIDEFIDEEFEGERGNDSGKVCPSISGRTVTLQMLLSAKILEPGKGTMTIEYLGQKFVGDLLPDGKIKSQETDIVFATPSAWAIHCKRIINPDKKSGCGWASCRYKGKKLDAYKNIWFKKRSELLEEKGEDPSEGEDEPEQSEQQTALSDSKPVKSLTPPQRIVVKHNTIPNRAVSHDGNTMIECTPFSLMGKIQPFLISITSSSLLLMDFHCHLNLSEVAGYLAGHWDFNTHTLSITHTFPCLYSRADRDAALRVESEIARTVERLGLTLAGWYHSHPRQPAAPTLRDIDAQLDHQIRMKGAAESNYTPCVGFIASPYGPDSATSESSVVCYWVIPPPENKPLEYGRPALMTYTTVQDATLSPGLMEDMTKCAGYYRDGTTAVPWREQCDAQTTFLQKLRSSLASKLPRDQSEAQVWTFVKDILTLADSEDTTTAPAVPPPLPPPTHSGELPLSADITGVLLQAGKLGNMTALLGLTTDATTPSQLAATNSMFLSPSLFKMQEHLNLLKPLSTGGSPLATSSPKSSKNNSGVSCSSSGGPDAKKIKIDSSPVMPTPASLAALPLAVQQKPKHLDLSAGGIADLSGKCTKFSGNSTATSETSTIPNISISLIPKDDSLEKTVSRLQESSPELTVSIQDVPQEPTNLSVQDFSVQHKP